VFIIINSNNPMSQIITPSQSKNGSGVVATVSIIHVQKIVKTQNNHTKVMTRKLLASFLWTQCTVNNNNQNMQY